MLNKINFNYYKAFALCLGGSFALINLLIVVVNHYCFRTYAYDYAVYNFVFYDFAHFRISPCPLYLTAQPISFMQDHFSITMILISPLYWLLAWLTGSYTLLIIQWGCIILGGWATYKLIELKNNDYKMAALALLYYFVLFGRFTSCDSDFNLAIIGSAIIPVFLYFFEAKKITAAVVCFLVLSFNREDYPLWLFFICVFLMIINRKDPAKFRFASILLVCCVVFFFLIFKVFIPGLESEYKKYDFFQFHALGETPAEALLFIFKHPIRTFELLFVNHTNNPGADHLKENFYLIYGLSGGAVLLLRPAYLIPFLPLLAKKMYTDEPFRWSIISYYSVEFISTLPVFVFLLLSTINWRRTRSAIAVLVCIISIAVTYHKIDKNWYAMSSDSSKFGFFRPDFYESRFETAAINEVIRAIPGGAAVSASCRITPHLALREKIYLFPRVDNADYILLFKHDDSYPLSNEEYDRKMHDLTLNPEWKIAEDKKDFILFKRQ